MVSEDRNMINRRDMLLGASAAATLPAFPASGKKTTRFIQITDSHIGQRGRQHEKIMKQLVGQMNRLPMSIDFAIHTGDIVHDNILDEDATLQTKAIFDSLDMPVHFTPGNHDILHRKQSEMTEVFEKHFGKLVDVHDYEGLALVTVYTEPLAKNVVVPGFQPLEELDATLDLLKGKPVIVAHHIPSVGSFYNNRDHKGWPQETTARWTELLNRHSVTAVIAGHFHRSELFRLGEVPLHVAPPVSTSWGRQPAYRIYTLENNHLSYRTQYLDG